MATATDQTLQVKALSTSLTVDDIQKSIRFFEGLGFVKGETWDEGGKVVGAMLKAGDAELGVMQDDWKKGRDRQKGVGFRLFIQTTQDVDQIAARAKAAGITLDSEPRDTEWGSRAFEVTEPTGFKITIAHQK
jgi:uncharacterized glyoxalase superfamily protein PhnB